MIGYRRSDFMLTRIPSHSEIDVSRELRSFACIDFDTNTWRHLPSKTFWKCARFRSRALANRSIAWRPGMVDEWLNCATMRYRKHENGPATPLPECIEGPEAFKRFDTLVDSVLSVPRSTLKRRETIYRKKKAANPNKRGPKPKINPSASHDPAA